MKELVLLVELAFAGVDVATFGVGGGESSSSPWEDSPLDAPNIGESGGVVCDAWPNEV